MNYSFEFSLTPLGSEQWFIIAMGIGTVFVALICIVILLKLLSGIIRLFTKPEQPAPVGSAEPVAAPIDNRQEIIAAVSAAIAEELGTDVSAIRIQSFKKI